MQIGETLEVHSPEEWREWLVRNHPHTREIWLVFFKKYSGKQTLDYSAAVEEALCFGWIDGQLKSIDTERYALRFSPRRPRGNWSESNRTIVRRLAQEGRMTEAGIAALPPDMSW